MAALGDSEIYAPVLAHLRDGVVTLDLAGRIITFNPAAGVLLDTAPEAALGQPFAELFFADPAFEALSELVLEAIYEPSVTHSREIHLILPTVSRTLLVHTTLLAGRGGGGGGEARGVIVVLSDLSEQRKRRKLKRLFGAYVDPRIVERLVAQADHLEAASREATTIAFLDMEGFTRIAERLGAADLVRLLNTYLEEMSIPVGANQGVTDKYIGDAIMAFWSPVFVREGEPAALACRAALAQRQRLGPLRHRLRQELDLPLEHDAIETRCGIATGYVLAGSIGPEHARNYTVIGDAVNVAARLEAANKALGTRILVAASTRERAGDDFVFRSRGTIDLPGRSRPEPVFELVGER